MTTPTSTAPVTTAATAPDHAIRPTISISRWRSAVGHPRLVSFGWAPVAPIGSQR